MATPVIQYGLRDEDDDSDCGGRRSSTLFKTPRKLKKLSNPKKKLGRVLNDTRTLLKGASQSYSHSISSTLYGMDSDGEDSDEDSSSSYESESSSDDGSVCSRSSVASAASAAKKTMQMLGSSFRGSLTVGGGGSRRNSKDGGDDILLGKSLNMENSMSSLRGLEDGDDDDDDDDMNQSSSSVVKMVKGTLSKALKVSGHRRRSTGNKKDLGGLGDGDFQFSDSEEEEEDLLENVNNNRRLKVPGFRRSNTTGGEDTKKMRGLPRRTKSYGDGDKPQIGRRSLRGGLRPTTTTANKNKPRRHTTADLTQSLHHSMKLTGTTYDDDDDDDDDHHLHSSCVGRPQVKRRNTVTKFSLDNGSNSSPGGCPEEEKLSDSSSLSNSSHNDHDSNHNDDKEDLIHNSEWAMNVTPEILEGIKGGGAGGSHHQMNIPKSALVAMRH